MDRKFIVTMVVAVITIAAIAVAFYESGNSDEKETKGGFYAWDPEVVTVNGNYSNCTPAFMSIAENVYKEVYGEIPSYSNISRADIPSKYLYNYTDYVVSEEEKSITILTFDNTSTGKTEAYKQKTISIPEEVICYTDAYVDTIYMILCDYYGEKAHSGDSPQAEAALWKLIHTLPKSVIDGIQSKYGLTVPSDVQVLGATQEDLVNYCQKNTEKKIVVFMSEYNIRSTNTKSWWSINSTIESHSSTQFVYLLSNSPGMVLSTMEMIGKIIGKDNTDAMMTSVLAEIYVMQKAIDESGKTYTFYCETNAGKAVGSNTLMGGIFASILKMQNVFDGDLMGSSMSDEKIIEAHPEIIAFYSSDVRSDDEKMRVPTATS